jgi:heme/copper-type cytochrome/quinol oxidase subunit 2
MGTESLNNSDVSDRRTTVRWISFVIAACVLAAQTAFGDDASQVPNIFTPESTPAHSIFQLSIVVLIITTVIFVIVFSLLAYSVIKFRKCADDDGREPVPCTAATR